MTATDASAPTIGALAGNQQRCGHSATCWLLLYADHPRRNLSTRIGVVSGFRGDGLVGGGVIPLPKTLDRGQYFVIRTELAYGTYYMYTVIRMRKDRANEFKARLDKIWLHQAVKFDFVADLTGTGNRSEGVI